MRTSITLTGLVFLVLLGAWVVFDRRDEVTPQSWTSAVAAVAKRTPYRVTVDRAEEFAGFAEPEIQLRVVQELGFDLTDASVYEFLLAEEMGPSREDHAKLTGSLAAMALAMQSVVNSLDPDDAYENYAENARKPGSRDNSMSHVDEFLNKDYIDNMIQHSKQSYEDFMLDLARSPAMRELYFEINAGRRICSRPEVVEKLKGHFGGSIPSNEGEARFECYKLARDWILDFATGFEDMQGPEDWEKRLPFYGAALMVDKDGEVPDP